MRHAGNDACAGGRRHCGGDLSGAPRRVMGERSARAIGLESATARRVARTRHAARQATRRRDRSVSLSARCRILRRGSADRPPRGSEQPWIRRTGIALVAAIVCGSPVRAADIAAGREKAELCVGCHGEGGISQISELSSLRAGWGGRVLSQTALCHKRLKKQKNSGDIGGCVAFECSMVQGALADVARDARAAAKYPTHGSSSTCRSAYWRRNAWRICSHSGWQVRSKSPQAMTYRRARRIHRLSCTGTAIVPTSAEMGV